MVNEISSYTPTQIPARTVAADRSAAPPRAEVGLAVATEKNQKTEEKDNEKNLGVAPPVSASPDAAAEKVNVLEVVKEMKDYVQSIERDLEFSVDEESGRTVITVKDSQTDEIIRQIPPEDLLYMIKAIQENSASLFVKVKA